ncbi:RNA 2',3'-cyclic phosphodiesterase [Acidobacteriota bacterium]
MRIFIAIEIDKSIKDNLIHLLEKLNKQKGNVKWVKRQGMHITLKFLGEITAEKMSDLKAALRTVANKLKPFPISFQGTGTFPTAKKQPKVLWVGIEKNDNLKLLQGTLEHELEKLGYQKENREFSPHLTMGRVKVPFQLEMILSVFEKYRETHFGTMMVRQITLFKSTLRPTGAEYTALEEFKLR